MTTPNRPQTPGQTENLKSIPISPAPVLPRAVAQTCRKLSTGGFKAWLAGGCVRDFIMGRKPRDWDIVTDAPLEKIREFFPEHLEVGIAFGIVKLPPAGTKTDPVHVDIAIFRKEGGYSDLRHPDHIEPGNEETDVARRDFTVNALYFDPETSTVFDYVGGHKDIGAKLIRAVGDPNKRFSEDALRILRAVRFSAQLGFKIERETAAALKKNGLLLRAVSRERVREEIFRLFTSPRPVMGLEALMQNALWEAVWGAKRLSLPADLRQFRTSWVPTALHWLCGLGVTGLFGDPLNEPHAVLDRLTENLRLSNAESRILGRALRIYEDSKQGEGEKPISSPMEWVELAKQDKQLVDMIKAFVRRARGPSAAEKTRAIQLADQAQRIASKPHMTSSWPTAETLMKEGRKAGPELGTELKIRQWKAFWAAKSL